MEEQNNPPKNGQGLAKGGQASSTILLGAITAIVISAIFIGGYFLFFKKDMNEEKEENVVENTVTEQGENFVTMKTNLGDIKLELFKKDAPITVENFLKLSQEGFYDGTKFHRVIKDFMIQGGDPNSKDDDWSDDGMGGPGYSFADEINQNKLIKGVLAMANSGPNTNGSQFFIVTAESTPWLDGLHTAFGRVVEGMDVVEKIENVAVDKSQGDHPVEDVTILNMELE